MDDRIPEEEKTRRLMVLQEKQRAIQIRRNAALVGSSRRGAGGRTQPGARASGSAALRRTGLLNFTHPGAERRFAGGPLPGRAGDARGPQLAGGRSLLKGPGG